MLSEYEKLSKEALEIHGPSAVLLLQVGSFWELYWYIDKQGNFKTIGADNARAVRELLGLQLMGKGPKTLESPYKTGIPMKEACNEKINRVLDSGYVVCLGEQATTKTAKGTLERQIGRCFSPSMKISGTDADHEGNYACCVYVFEAKSMYGAAMIDVSTGCSIVIELPHSLGDLGCFVMSRNVREVFLIGKVTDKRKIRQILDPMWPLRKVAIHDHFDGNLHKDFLNPAFISDALSRAYGTSLDLSDQARKALGYLLQITRTFSLSYGEKLTPPQIIEPGDHLSLSANALQQLGIHKLLDVLNQPMTPMGKRLFRERLCTPTSNIEVIEQRHAKVQDAVDRANSKAMRDLLIEVGDLQKWSRKICKQDAKLSEAQAFIDCVEAAKAVATFYEDMDAETLSISILESMKSLDTKSEMLFPENDAVKDAFALFHESTKALDKLRADLHKDAKLDQSAEGVYSIKLTAAKWATISEQAKVLYTKTSTSGGVKLWNATLEEAANALIEHKLHLSVAQDAAWKELLAEIPTFNINTLSEFISELDVTYACAFNASTFGHVKPRIADASHGSFSAKDLGNPVAEHCMKNYTDEAFVKNDVTLDPEQPHMILLGLNGSGKSVLLKSVGTAVIMAQAGMFVPCSELILSPFTRIDTRILTSDDIERGHSSYNSELLEMLQAIEFASPKSLFLADEMCSTTEWASAVALVGQMIAELHDSGSTTLVTTHYHEILQHPNIKELSVQRSVQIKHMSTSIDPGVGIVYDRTIADGPCAPSYGIRVAAAMGFSPSFIREATTARDALTKDEAIVARKSRYNKAKVISACEICGKPAVDTHHIIPQSEQVQNDISNLMALCKECHKEAHSGNKEAVRVNTPSGTQALWKIPPPLAIPNITLS